MKQDVSSYDFCKAFEDYDRTENFSHEGLVALYEYLISYEEDCDKEIDLDVIALCCEYSEYENLAELQKNYGNIETMEDLENNTTVIPIEGTDRFIIADY